MVELEELRKNRNDERVKETMMSDERRESLRSEAKRLMQEALAEPLTKKLSLNSEGIRFNFFNGYFKLENFLQNSNCKNLCPQHRSAHKPTCEHWKSLHRK